MLRMVRNIFVFGIVNIFLMLLVSVLMEYNSLSERLQQLENTVSTSVETALDTSMASEELFNEKFSNKVYSVSGGLNSDKRYAVSSQIRVYRNGTWVTGNPYIMSFYLEDKGKFPESQTDYDNYSDETFRNDWDIFERLFGDIHSDYNDSSLSWGNTNKTTKTESSKINNFQSKQSLGDRQPQPDFKEFYDRVGKNMISYQNIKRKDGKSFRIEPRYYPTLANMGLKLADGSTTRNPGGQNNPTIVNANISSIYTLDNWVMSAHVGKSRAEGTKVLQPSRYYLTPYSLGVTYVPTNVFKGTLLAHLEQSVRFNKIKSGDITDSSFDATAEDGGKSLSTADGCITTSVYDGGTQVTHKDSTGDQIINDGLVEYDLSTLKVKVDYQLVDFYDDANYQIVNRVLGSKSGFDINGNKLDGYKLGDLPKEIKDADTSTDKEHKDGYRIVARVSAKVKIHIPYQSPIMQWMSYLESKEDKNKDKDNHYGIRLWNPETSSMVEDEDGLWYQYTTFRAISR